MAMQLATGLLAALAAQERLELERFARLPQSGDPAPAYWRYDERRWPEPDLVEGRRVFIAPAYLAVAAPIAFAEYLAANGLRVTGTTSALFLVLERGQEPPAEAGSPLASNAVETPLVQIKAARRPKRPVPAEMHRLLERVSRGEEIGPVTVDRRTGEIVAGVDNYYVAVELGLATVPVVWSEAA